MKNLWKKYKNSIFKAHIADIDGNLTPLNGSYENVCSEVITSIKNKLINGIPFGICSARSIKSGLIIENIKNAIIGDLSNKELKHFFIFPEQGSKAVWYEKNNNTIITNEINLVKFFKIVPDSLDRVLPAENEMIFEILTKELKQTYSYPVIKIKSEKDYGFSALVIKQDYMNEDEYSNHVKTTTKIVNKILQNNKLDFEGFCTRTSIFIAKSGVNKELSLKFISHTYQIPKEEIIATDDQCDETGVGYSLTKHFGGVATAFGDDNSELQLNIAKISGKKGVNAWLYLDKHIKYMKPKN